MSWGESVTIGLAVAVITIALLREIWVIRKHLNLDDWTPTRKWKKQFDGSRRVPKHQPDRIPQNANANERNFFRDTSMIVHWLNDAYTDTPWSFESTGELLMSYETDNGAEREIVLWYNEVKTGWISFSSWGVKNSSVHVKLSLINARIYPGIEVFGIATSLAQLVSETPAALHEARDQIQTVMIDSMWQKNRDFGNPELKFRFTGQLKDHILPSSSYWQSR